MSSVEIRRLLSGQEFDQTVELQKVYWGTDASNLVPRHMLHSLCHHGGHLIGAYDGSRLVGFVMGFLGTAVDPEKSGADRTPASLLIMSKRMLVLPGYRGRNIGLKLKMAQRDIALKQAIPLVTWTFDPLLSRNAHLNIRKLGGISCRFAMNYFGYSDAESLTADRLIVQWWVNSDRAQACASGRISARTLEQCLDENTRIINPANESDSDIEPCGLWQVPSADSVLLEIPSDIRQLEANFPKLARRWRTHIRELLGILMESGYVVDDFISSIKGNRRRAYYYLQRRELLN